MSIGYILKEGIAGLGRAKIASFTSMFSLFVAVFLIGVMARVAYNIYEIGKTLRQSVTIEVFLENMDRHSEERLKNRLLESDIVADISYISKDSAAAIFKREFGSGGAELAELNFLPASFRITVKEGVEIEQINNFISNVSTYNGVEEVDFNRKLLELLQARLENVLIIGSGIAILILLTTLILVFNTIRLTIYAKRGLIKAMKLVGATNSFIRSPFLVEGILQGIIAGGAGILTHYALFQYIVPRFVPQLGVLSWPFEEWYYLTTGLLLLSVLMGYFGSRWAARRFINNVTVSN